MNAPKHSNRGKPWSTSDDELLQRLAEGNTPPKAIADQLGRSLVSVLGRATLLKISIQEGKRKRRMGDV